jgi:hypothetical protein
MRLKLLSLALLALTCLPFQLSAQVDVPVNSIGPIFDVARNVNWNGSGPGNVNNNYIFTPTQTDQGTCFYLYNNNPTTVASFTIAVYQTGDAAVATFQNNTAKWVNIYSQSAKIAAASSQNYFVRASGAARMALVISGGGIANTATITAVQTSQSCGMATAFVPTPCASPATAHQTIATGTTALLVTGVANKKIYICAYSAELAGAGSLVFSADDFIEGTGGTCAAGTSAIWQWFNGQATFEIHELASSATLFNTQTFGNNLCFRDGGSTGTWKVNLSYVIL